MTEDEMYMYHSFLIHSSADGHLGCFHVLAIINMGCHLLLQGIFPTQESNPGLPHCRQILYQLSHKGSPRILGWVAYPFSSRSSRPRNQTRVSCTAGGFFTLGISNFLEEISSLSYSVILLYFLEWVAMPSSRESSRPRD